MTDCEDRSDRRREGEKRYSSYREITAEIEVGRVYNGKVTRIVTLAHLLPSAAVKKVWSTSLNRRQAC